MSKRKKILLIGGSSFVGRHLFSSLGTEGAVATYCSAPFAGGVYFNALIGDLMPVLEEFGPFSHAVILLGETNPDTCAADKEASYALNVQSIKRVIDCLTRGGVKPVFMSSEFVFDGLRGGYTEEDEVNPILTYGWQKVEVERYLLEICDRYTIVRLAKTFGSGKNDGTLFTGWIRAIKGGCEIRCACDQIFSPIYVDDVVQNLIRLIDLDYDGVFHLSTPQAYSRIELLEMLIEEMRRYVVVNPRVVRCSIHDFDLAEKRPLNVSMKPDKLTRVTGGGLQDVSGACRQIVGSLFASGG